VRVLIIDDSASARLALRLALEEEPDIEVVGEVERGAEAMSALERLRPDLVTLDLYLGEDDGLEVAETIMAQQAVPIVLVTAADAREPSLVYRAMEVGVLDVSAKLPGPDRPEYPERRRRLVRLLRNMATVPVVHRGGRRRRGATDAARGELPPSPSADRDRSGGAGILVIGASTGGPPVVAQLLAALPRPFPHPIALVQHIMPDFVEGFASWLASVTSLPVTLARDDVALEPGRVYVAVADHHLVVRSTRKVSVSVAPPIRHQRPSVDLLFEGAATHFGAGAVGVLLTGMGEDGAVGMEQLRRAGGHTLAQEPSTCAVDSMPKSAMARDAVSRVATPAQLPALVMAAFERLGGGSRTKD